VIGSNNYWKLITPGFRSSGIRAGLIQVAGVEAENGEIAKKLWFDELQELNQILQEENVGLNTLLHVAEEENQRLQE
jgi:hypothetical protein